MSVTHKKESDIKAAAKELFWRHGFKRVSIEEICQKANASKMTFYKYFPNKQALAKTIFNDAIDQGERVFRDILYSNDLPAVKIKKILLMKLEGTNNISQEFIKDFYIGGDPDLSKFVEQRTTQAWDLLRNDYKKAQEIGLFRDNFNPEMLIKMQFKLMELMEDPTIVSMYGSQQDVIMEFANLLVYGIIPREESVSKEN
jgi:AcrR family transcriptional regulator